ncbi:MAG: N-6 DNA methylase [Methanobrevibacter sp.]|nr:N-6 DNA methylase [Methanosphaera sp.]MBR0371065.1 N-6 DNA methylase [Methanobrevibacter sp.]
MTTFEKKFKEISSSYDPQKAWEEWLDYVIDINLFTTVNQNLDFNGREKDYYELFLLYLRLMHREVREDVRHSGVVGWSDYLGVFYENNIKTGYKASARGQYFTPPHIAEVMAELTMENNNYKNTFLMDSCCGSGRFLLAGHNKEPLVIGFGIDLDETSVKMTTINLMFHGARGTVIHGNSISGEFFKGYKVNQYLGFGLPVPHVELLNSYEDGFQYLGVENNNDKNIVEPLKEELITGKGSYQSTLI